MIGVVLALRSMWRHRLPHIVAGTAVISVLTPLLILYGVKTGVVDGLIGDMKKDPRVLSLAVSGHVSLAPEEIQRIRLMPETRFAVGATRSSAARMEFEARGGKGGYFNADIAPTAPGDPLLDVPGLATLPDDQVVLSQGLADKLGVSAGAKVIGRNLRNGNEEIAMRFTVAGILSPDYLAGDRALASEGAVQTLEAFLDGYEVPSLGIGGRPLSKRVKTYESLRVYARTIDGVVSLDRALQALGFRVRSNAAQIMLVQNLDKVMAGLFLFIASAGAIGFVVSFWAALVSIFEQYRRHTSLLKLLGLEGLNLAAFPVVQAMLTATVAIVVSLLLYGAMAAAINRTFSFGYIAGDVCALRPIHFVVAVAAVYVVALGVCAYLVRSMNRIAPAEAVRSA